MQTAALGRRLRRDTFRASLKPVAAGAGLALLGILLPDGEAFGYRFFRRTANHPAVSAASEALRWDPAVWGPGKRLRWVIGDDPEWTEPWESPWGEVLDAPFASREEVIPFVRKGLEAWSSLPSADIGWSVAGLGGELHAARDHVNAVRMNPFHSGASYANIWEVNGQIVECDVSLTPWLATDVEGQGLKVLMHEFGHCVGLAHAAPFPTWDTWPWRRGFQPALWGADPLMSYGYKPEARPIQDDIVGASLLRPARGWLQRVGSITGQVTMNASPARYVPVFATHISADGVVASANAFTNGEGYFAIEGLAPGEYLLVAGSMGDVGGSESLVDLGATLGSRDQYLLDPVRVGAGRETRVPPILLREGRATAPLQSE